MIKRNSHTFKLDKAQQAELVRILKAGNYIPVDVPHTLIAVDGPDCKINLYKSGKCLVQGKGGEDWISFVLEPQVIKEVRLGYEDVLSPEMFENHMGIDESGKGDFFGPLVIASAYVDEGIVASFREIDVRDSKTVTSDRKIEQMARSIRDILKGRFALITIGPRAYNRLYSTMGNVNKILAWGHARAIENLMEKVPDCPRAVADQFGPERQIKQALMKNGRSIKLVQRPKAESDPAVAAASILARAGFVRALQVMQKEYDVTIPKGASEQVREAARVIVKNRGPEVLLDVAKCHFRTTDMVLGAAGFDRTVLGKEGQAMSKDVRRDKK
ncbi:MAG: ribonuclease HIII [Verrucomicrobia bacterium]|nr:ribonuclease HIII [Verrucomicrobiota bacterium]